MKNISNLWMLCEPSKKQLRKPAQEQKENNHAIQFIQWIDLRNQDWMWLLIIFKYI